MKNLVSHDVNSFYFFPQRKTFLIDQNGVLVHIIDSVNINSHADDVLAIFKKIKENYYLVDYNLSEINEIFLMRKF